MSQKEQCPGTLYCIIYEGCAVRCYIYTMLATRRSSLKLSPLHLRILAKAWPTLVYAVEPVPADAMICT